MRIIGGKHRSVVLNTPKNYDIRPTTDHCKESLFNIIGYDIIDAKFLDLFAGTGSVGIEAISRDARNVTLVDMSIESINLINQNLKKVKETAQVHHQSSERFLANTSSKFDIIFIDPPYEDYRVKIVELIEMIKINKLLEEDGYIIVELDVKDQIEVDGFDTFKFKKYGKTSFSFLRLK